MKYLYLLRIHHWAKNLFVLMPLFFAARMAEPPLLYRGLLATLGFCLLSSAVYIMNDAVDRQWDRQHPQKRLRPLAQGTVTLPQAYILLAVGCCAGLLLLFWVNVTAVILGISYLIINVLYSFWFKHIAIVDITLIALGFLIRIYLGEASTGAQVSHWLAVLTFLLALILGFSKRRGEYIIYAEGVEVRKALEGYNLVFLNAAIVFSATAALVAYLMYCFSPEVTSRIGNDKIYYTGFFVVLGLLRFMQLVFVENTTVSPMRLLWQDHFLKLILLLWIGSFALLLYR